jgi:hypothetical protein
MRTSICWCLREQKTIYLCIKFWIQETKPISLRTQFLEINNVTRTTFLVVSSFWSWTNASKSDTHLWKSSIAGTTESVNEAHDSLWNIQTMTLRNGWRGSQVFWFMSDHFKKNIWEWGLSRPRAFHNCWQCQCVSSDTLICVATITTEIPYLATNQKNQKNAKFFPLISGELYTDVRFTQSDYWQMFMLKVYCLNDTMHHTRSLK